MARTGSTLITSQLPVDAWHDVIDEPTFADAILDRLVHNSYRLELDGPSMRKTKVRQEEPAALCAQDARPASPTGTSHTPCCVRLVAVTSQRARAPPMDYRDGLRRA